jgi:DNA-binding transcriptional LysR family regulator
MWRSRLPDRSVGDRRARDRRSAAGAKRLLVDLEVARRGEQRCQLRLALASGDPFLLRSLAARGFATAILPQSLTTLDGPAIEVRSLLSAVDLPVALVWRRERDVPPAARAFIDLVRAEVLIERHIGSGHREVRPA